MASRLSLGKRDAFTNFLKSKGNRPHTKVFKMMDFRYLLCRSGVSPDIERLNMTYLNTFKKPQPEILV
jgi:hypothetical protein